MSSKKVHLVQLKHPSGRRIALVNGLELVLITNFSSVYELALEAIKSGRPLADIVDAHLSEEKPNYDEVYNDKSDWKLLPAFDHPVNPALCLVSGTGLTHKNSALNRQSMHETGEKPTDSMIMYRWGVEGGSPQAGNIGAQPEWFYKGQGTMLKAHGEALEIPPYANDGGEEPEVAGIYIVDENGQPHRIGFATGNEFSDHVMEKKNYLYLAPSKLRQCAIGPEIVIGADFASFTGKVSVHRNSQTLWESPIKSGEANMAHNLANLEYHHFKYEGHRIPLQAHVHFFGADAFSFGNKLLLQHGDEMEVYWDSLGRPLRNYVKVSGEKESIFTIPSI